ncbi:efflux RND transporter periplasmic adaptor subunit [Thioalkalivibrio sulfidiphilus]|nr:efflux RND transporter periplasmic adaptor subunit [Thioalkalivibrio sulfidiphilus]
MVHSARGEVLTVQSVASADHTLVNGRVIPFREITLRARLPGTLLHVGPEAGDQVPPGSLLAVVSHQDLLAQRDAQIATIRHAQAVLENSQIHYMREIYSPRGSGNSMFPGMFGLMDSMMGNGFNTMLGNHHPLLDRHANLHDSSVMVHQAQTAISAAQARLREIEVRLADAMTVAPMEGVITQRHVEPGEYVQPGQALFGLAHTRWLKVEADVPTRLMAGVGLGQEIGLRLDGQSATVNGRVSRIAPGADTRSQTVRVELDLPADVIASVGQMAELRLTSAMDRSHQRLLLPQSAIIQRGSLPSVRVQDPDGSLRLRVVRLGERLADGRVEVLSGLSPGDRVVNGH